MFEKLGPSCFTVARARDALRLTTMDLGLLEKPLLHVWGHDVSFLGIIAFAIWFAIGVAMSRVVQHDVIRRLLNRLTHLSRLPVLGGANLKIGLTQLPPGG